MNTGALWTLLIIAAVIAFIGSIKATVIISYSDEVELCVKVLFIKIKILPSKEKRGKWSMSAKQAEKMRAKLRKKAEKKKLSDEEKEKKKAEKKETKEKKSVSEIISIIKLVSSLAVMVIEKFFGHLRIRLARIRIIVATGDAATTAIAYGAITQSLNILLPTLEGVKNFEKLDKADIDVGLDYAAEEPTIDIKLAFSVRVWHVFDIAFGTLGKLIKHLFSNMGAKDKGSAPEKSTTPTQNKK